MASSFEERRYRMRRNEYMSTLRLRAIFVKSHIWRRPSSTLETVLKVLGDRTRLRILGLLLQGEICVCDIHETLKVPQPKVSRHLAVLAEGGPGRDASTGPVGAVPTCGTDRSPPGVGGRRRSPGAGAAGRRAARCGAPATAREQLHPRAPHVRPRRDAGEAGASAGGPQLVTLWRHALASTASAAWVGWRCARAGVGPTWSSCTSTRWPAAPRRRRIC